MVVFMSLEHLTIREFLHSLAAKTPTPGGGAVAGVVAALSAALAQMVVNYSIGKKKLAEHDALHRRATAQLSTLGERAMALAEADAQAYARLNELLKLDANDSIRQQEIVSAVHQASEPAWQVMLLCKECLVLLGKLCGRSNAMLRSDLAIAAILAHASAKAAWWNITVNMPLIRDEQTASELKDRIEAALESIAQLAGDVESACRDGQ